MCKDPAMAVAASTQEGRRPHEVAVLALDGVVGLELGLPHRMLGMAEDDGGHPLYRVRVATPDGRPVRTADGFSVQADHDISLLDEAQTVVIPGMEGGPALTEGRIPEAVDTALQSAAGHARLVSICTGASVLAAAGLLDGRPATTHWRDTEQFRTQFPAVRLDPDVLFVDDGDVLTSAGVAAGIDLLLHLVRRDHGSRVANRVARRNVVAPWRAGGQAQFIERPVPEADDWGTTATREWALQRLGEPVTLADLAAHAQMSVRTFTRRFREETGSSASRWLVQQRVALARRLLESTDTPVDQVATEAGFGTAASLRQHLHAAIGVAPLAYRRTYRGTVPSPDVTGDSPV
jgi:transcriptional regulator GlxA family with amidase domain